MELSSEQLETIVTTVVERIPQLKQRSWEYEFTERFAKVDERVARVEEGMLELGKRFARVEERMIEVDNRVARVEERMVELGERTTRVEEELKSLRELTVERFKIVDQRFEYFMREMDQRFSATDKRMAILQWSTMLGFTLLGALMTFLSLYS